MNVSLPDQLKGWAESRVAEGRYSSTSDYVRDLVRRDQEREEKRRVLQAAIDEGLASPIPDRLFDEVVSKFPANLFYRGHRVAAIEVAGQIEKKAGGNTKQLLSLAGFHLGIENGGEAKRLAARAVTRSAAARATCCRAAT